MAKGFRVLIIAVALMLPGVLLAQAYHSSYDPQSLIRRLSYENFRNIKMLQTAIMNYGGGETELEELVDEYAEASALYFQNKIEDAANKFQENERNILKASQNISKIYFDETTELVTSAVKMNVRNAIKADVQPGSNDGTVYADKFLANAQFSYNKAVDYHDRYINAETANARNLITAIYYFRLAKNNIFTMIEHLTFSEDEEKNKEIIKEQLAKYEKDMVDNENKVYQSREKQN